MYINIWIQVGEVFIKGVSEEDRRRTNIGMELVISDGILFLDEPTDGLDAPSSIAIVRTLKKLVVIVVLSVLVQFKSSHPIIISYTLMWSITQCTMYAQYFLRYILYIYYTCILCSSVSKNYVVIMSLRQAQYSMYNLFNTLTLLSRGQVVYHGPAGEVAVDYFRDNGMWVVVYHPCCNTCYGK